MESRSLPTSQISGRMYIVQYRCFSLVYDVKSMSQPLHFAVTWKQVLNSNKKETGFADLF